MNNDHSVELQQNNISEICMKCGAHCCTFGGAIASESEVMAIKEKAHPNHFVKISDGFYVTKWVNKGICPYLVNNLCSIYDVRPSGCRAFPVVQVYGEGIFLVKCPLSQYLGQDELNETMEFLVQRPQEALVAALSYRQNCENILNIRATRYEMVYLKGEN